MKLTNADSNGAAAIFYQTMPPKWGPPLHRHSREDERKPVWGCSTRAVRHASRLRVHPESMKSDSPP